MIRPLRIAATLLLVTGCSGIPSSSEVRFGDEINGEASAQFVRVIARPPVAGMEPEALIRGFLDANADSTDNFAIAREYLLPELINKWAPESGIEIYGGESLDLSVNENRATGTGEKFGSVSEAGRYEVAAPGVKVKATFTVAKNASGEWRISDLKNGLYLSIGDVERSYRSFPLYFMNPEKTALVSDGLIIPVSSSGITTKLMNSLLAGASGYLSQSTANPFPDGTYLTFGAVPIDNGQAQVDLSPEVLAASEVDRRALSAQIVWTLSTLPSVSTVRISVSGQPLALEDVGSVQTLDDWRGFSPAEHPGSTKLNLIRGSQVIQIGETGSEIQVAGANVRLGAAQLDAAGNQIAAVSADGSAMLRALVTDGQFALVASGNNFTAPSWDPYGNIFVSDLGTGVSELRSDGTLRNVLVDVTSLGSSDQIKHLAISKDGVRVALVFSGISGDTIAVGSIVRTEVGTRIAGIHRIEREIVSVADLKWKTPTSLAAIALEKDGVNRLVTISAIDGGISSKPVPSGTESVTVDEIGQVAISTSDNSGQVTYLEEFGAWKAIGSGRAGYFSP